MCFETFLACKTKPPKWHFFTLAAPHTIPSTPLKVSPTPKWPFFFSANLGVPPSKWLLSLAPKARIRYSPKCPPLPPDGCFGVPRRARRVATLGVMAYNFLRRPGGTFCPPPHCPWALADGEFFSGPIKFFWCAHVVPPTYCPIGPPGSRSVGQQGEGGINRLNCKQIPFEFEILRL